MAMTLDDVRVVDCSTGIGGPLAATMLADHGADVVKVEPPGGEPGRAHPGFAYWNRNKRGIVLDPATDDGARRLAALLVGADVLVVSGSIDQLRGTPLDPEAARAAHPHLVVFHAGPYMETAPWAGAGESPALVSSLTGVADRQYSIEDRPVDIVIPLASYAQGIWGAACIVAALIERRRSGHGQRVLVGGLHGMLETSVTPQFPDQPRVHMTHSANPFYRHYKCKDGEWIFLACLTAVFRTNALVALDLLDVLTDPRVDGEPANLVLADNNEWLVGLARERFATKARDEWIEIFEAGDCPYGPVLDRDDWLDHEQLRAIGMRVEIDDPERGPVVMGGVPAVFTRTPGAVRAPAPTLGQHDAEVQPWPARPAPTGEPAPLPGPLAGYRIIDLGTVIAGTYGASLLAGLGADVTKVEPLTGDTFRYAAGFGTLNLGKRGLALDVRDPSGHEAFLDLVRHNDVVIDNYRPGVLQRLGIHYDDLVQVKPDVVTVSVTGFGEGGPLSYRPGFDPVLQAMSGMMRAQGGDDDPVFYAPAVNDVITAASTAFSAVAGLHHRLVTGDGQRVWTSLTQSSALAQCGELVRYPGRPPAPRGGRDHLGPGPLDRFYETADGWIRLQATGPDGRARLAAAGVLPEAGGPAGDDDLAEAIAATLAGMKQEEALDRLYAAGVPAARSGDLQSLIDDEELVALEAVTVGRMGPRPHFHPFRLVRFGRTEVPSVAPVSPGLGEHSREVLLDHGFDEDRVAALLDAGVIAVGPPLDLSAYKT